MSNIVKISNKPYHSPNIVPITIDLKSDFDVISMIDDMDRRKETSLSLKLKQLSMDSIRYISKHVGELHLTDVIMDCEDTTDDIVSSFGYVVLTMITNLKSLVIMNADIGCKYENILRLLLSCKNITKDVAKDDMEEVEEDVEKNEEEVEKDEEEVEKDEEEGDVENVEEEVEKDEEEGDVENVEEGDVENVEENVEEDVDENLEDIVEDIEKNIIKDVSKTFALEHFTIISSTITRAASLTLSECIKHHHLLKTITINHCDIADITSIIRSLSTNLNIEQAIIIDKSMIKHNIMYNACILYALKDVILARALMHHHLPYLNIIVSLRSQDPKTLNVLLDTTIKHYSCISKSTHPLTDISLYKIDNVMH